MLRNISVFIAAAVLGFCAVPAAFSADPAAPPPAVPVSVAAVVQRDITKWSEFSGRLRAVEDVQIRPRVSGTIDAVLFREGDVIAKDAPLFTIDVRPYKAAHNQAAAAVAGARARASMAAADFKRAQTLFKQKAYSQREFDEKDNAQKEAAAAVKAAEAQLELAALNLEYADIKAPIAGRVGRPDITVGNMVEAGPGAQVLTTIQSLDPIYADFDIDEQTYLRAMKAVRAGQQAEMPVYMALADETEFKRAGKIRSFDNQLSGDSGTLRVRAEFPNPDGFLTPGLFARVRLGNAAQKNAVLINDSAIGTDQDRKFVYVVDEKGNVSYRPLVLGDMDGGLRVIEQGLEGNEKIVVNGLMRVHPGMQVAPMMVSMETLQSPDAPPPGKEPPAGDAVKE